MAKKDSEDEVYKSDEQEDEPSSDEKEQEMEEGILDEEVYDEEGREKLLEDDEIDDWEEGFMNGASAGGSRAKCSNCGKIFIDESGIVDREINDVDYWFCSYTCADLFEKKQKYK